MASIRKDIHTDAGTDYVWDAVRDVAALHTRLVPGFVINTTLESGVRIVTFANGAVVREPIVTIDDVARRLVWTVQGGSTTHYNASVEVSADDRGGSLIVWRADFLPDSLAISVETAMTMGAAVMKKTLDQVAQKETPD